MWTAFLNEHQQLTRRHFCEIGVLSGVIWQLSPLAHAAERSKVLEEAISKLAFLTAQNDFRDVSRGKPLPHSLSSDQMRDAGLTQDTWKLEVIADPESNADIRNPLTASKNTAFDFQQLLDLGKQHSVCIPKVMTCNNLACPLGTGIWEGVPLRNVLWLAKPRKNIRRVFYHGFHNRDPQQLFRSSLSIGRVLEDPPALPPVILCYKLNGEFLTPERGAPVRMVVPEMYGYKSIKWLTQVMLTNSYQANDTYAKQNNDIDSSLKTFAATIAVPASVPAGQPIPVTGYAQVGTSGLKKVQTWISKADAPRIPGDLYFTKGDWQDAEILGPPSKWGGGLLEDRIPPRTFGINSDNGQPHSWPLPLAKAHWATLIPGLAAGKYILRSRTLDARGIAQPLPRPFSKSGRNAIESISIQVT
ncbi:MAG: molybdopterin-dependent oxidoreductase [Planctomycetaceae bacterium]